MKKIEDFLKEEKAEFNALKEVVKLLNLQKTNSLDIQIDNIHTCFGKTKVKHFESLYIENYKIFKNFKIDRLNKINIFAGFNNSGKTSLLEAVYLLTKQNHIGAFFEIVKLKNKLNDLNSVYLNKVINKNIKISGKFNNYKTMIKISKSEAENINKKIR